MNPLLHLTNHLLPLSIEISYLVLRINVNNMSLIKAEAEITMTG